MVLGATLLTSAQILPKGNWITLENRLIPSQENCRECYIPRCRFIKNTNIILGLREFRGEIFAIDRNTGSLIDPPINLRRENIRVDDFVLSPSDNYIALISKTHNIDQYAQEIKVEIWDVTTGLRNQVISLEKDFPLQFGASETWLTNGNTIWDLEGTPIKEEFETSNVRVIATSTNEDLLAVGDLGGIVELWNIDTQKQITEYFVPKYKDNSSTSYFGILQDLTFGNNDQYIIGIVDTRNLTNSPEAARIIIWDADVNMEAGSILGDMVQTIPIQSVPSSIYALEKEALLLLGNDNGYLNVYDLLTGKQVGEINVEDEVLDMDYDPTTDTLLTCGYHGSINLLTLGNDQDDQGVLNTSEHDCIMPSRGTLMYEWQRIDTISSTRRSESGVSYGATLDISYDGDALLIGENGNSSKGSSNGAAHLLRYINNKWVENESPLLHPNPNQENMLRFGSYVSLDNNGITALVGGAHPYPRRLSDVHHNTIRQVLFDLNTSESYLFPVPDLVIEKFVLSGNGQTAFLKNHNADEIFVFNRQSDNGWRYEDTIVSPDITPPVLEERVLNKDFHQHFGENFATNIDGSILLVSSRPTTDFGELQSRGFVQEFRRSNNAWVEGHIFFVTDAQAQDDYAYGRSPLALSGDGHTAFISAPMKDPDSPISPRGVFPGSPDYMPPQQGAVYVYTYTDKWRLDQILRPRIPSISHLGKFGDSVDVDFMGDTVIVSQPEALLPGSPEQGLVYVFTRNTNNEWEEHLVLKNRPQETTATSAWPPQFFGHYDVKISGNGCTVAVGDAYNSGRSPESGGVYVFRW